MNKEGQNGTTVILPRQLTCWPALRTADDLKKDTHKSVYRAEINLITLIPDAASLEENSVCESMSSFGITSDGVSRLFNDLCSKPASTQHGELCKSCSTFTPGYTSR